jgi:hypothetical protein
METDLPDQRVRNRDNYRNNDSFDVETQHGRFSLVPIIFRFSQIRGDVAVLLLYVQNVRRANNLPGGVGLNVPQPAARLANPCNLRDNNHLPGFARVPNQERI